MMGGPAPLSLSYAYNVVNDGDGPVTGVTVSDTTCSNGAPAKDLAVGESMQVSCSALLPSPGSYFESATATGTANDLAPISSAPASNTIAVGAPLASVAPPVTPPPPAVKPPSKQVAFTLSAGFKPPPGISRARGCRGRVTVRLKAGKHVVATKTVSLNHRCRYTARFKVLRAKLRGATVVTLAARFRGNAALGPTSAHYRQRVPA
jgi:hypothetical protein